jgi:hypothetical protein
LKKNKKPWLWCFCKQQKKKTKEIMAMALDFAACGFESLCNEIKNMMMMNSILVIMALEFAT